MEHIWKTTVEELLTIFKGALISIIPWVERAHIKWQEESAYDDWDNIAQALFGNIVCSSLNGEVDSTTSIPKYNLYYEDYSSLDYIQVKSRTYPNKKFAFVSFQNISPSLNKIKVVELNELGMAVSWLVLEQDGLEYSFVKNENGEKKILKGIEIFL